MKKQLGFIVTLVMGFGLNSVQAANECRLKYKNGTSSYQYRYIDKGQTITLLKSNFIEGQNVGRNDMKLKLEYKDLLGNSHNEYLNLIKKGGITIALPIIPLIGKTLKKVECKSYATIIDTEQYIAQFGSSVSSLVSQANTAAMASVNVAVNTAKNAFNPSAANTYKTNAETAIQVVVNAFNAAKNEVHSIPANLRTNLNQHFPEVNQAVNASSGYAWKLGSSVITQGKQNINNTLTEINRIDQKYAVSSTVSKLVSINLAKDFPELNRLKNNKCNLTTNSVIQFNTSFNSLATELGKLDKKYKFSKTVGKLTSTLITVSSKDRTLLRKFSKAKNCNTQWQKLQTQLDADANALGKYLARVKAELSKLKAAQFKGRQSAFFVEVQKLVKTTDALIKEHQAQQRRKNNMQKAQLEHARAYKRISNDLGPIQDDLNSFPGGFLIVETGLAIKNNVVPDWLTDDPKRLQQLLSAEIKAAEKYKKSIEVHQDGKLKVNQKFQAWLKQTGSTVKSATRLKIRLPRTNQLISLLSRPPKLQVIDKAFNTVSGCVKDFITLQFGVVQVIQKSIQQYLNNISKIAQDAIPVDVRKALNELNNAVNDLSKKTISAAMGDSLKNTKSSLDKSLNKLWRLFKQDPTKNNFANQFKNLFQQVKQNLHALKADGTKASSDVKNYGTSIAKFFGAVDKLKRVMARHDISAWNDVKHLLNTATDVKVKWNEVNKLVNEVLLCADTFNRLIGQAEITFISRLNKLLESKVQVAVNSLPQNIKQKLQAIKSDLNSMQTKYNQFENAVNNAETAYQQASISRNDAVSSLVPFPKSDAPKKAQAALEKFNNLKLKLQTVDSKWKSLNTAQQKLTNDLGQLVTQMISKGTEVAADAKKLSSIPFDVSLVSSQLSGINNVYNKWNNAVSTLPSRLAALATGGMSTQIEAQIQQGISYMNSKNSELVTCVNTASTKRNSIGSQQQKTDAITQTLAGLHAQATAVRISLNALLPPTFNILNDIENTINKARVLSDRMVAIGTDASDQFMSNISSQLSQLNMAKNCVVSKHTMIGNKKIDLMNLINQ